MENYPCITEEQTASEVFNDQRISRPKETQYQSNDGSPTGEKQHLCTICDKKFASASDLYRHMIMRIHTREIPHVCYICNKSFVEKETLKAHIRTHPDETHLYEPHTDETHTVERNYPCTTTGKMFFMRDGKFFMF